MTPNPSPEGHPNQATIRVNPAAAGVETNQGANANNGTNAGLLALNGNNTAGNANVNNGAALTRSNNQSFPPSPHLSVEQMQGASIAPSRPPDGGPESAELLGRPQSSTLLQRMGVIREHPNHPNATG